MNPLEVWVFDQIFWPRPGEDRKLIPFPGRCWDPQIGMQQYDEHLEYLRRADELKFDGVCLTEHHYTTYGMASPNVMAAAVAVLTHHAKVVLMGNCVPLHANPVRLAEELAMLDVLSHGRLVSGLLRGAPAEWYNYGIDPATVRERFEEAWDLIVDCWTQPEPFTWNGKHFHYENVSVVPRCVQQPHLPLVMSASTAESIEWCARKRVPMAASFAPTDSMAENFKYYREYAQAECGWSPGPEHVMFSRQMYVAETDAKAREEVAVHLEAFYREVAGRKMPAGTAPYVAAQFTERSYNHKQVGKSGSLLIDKLGNGGIPTMDRLLEQGIVIIGSPETVLEQIRYQQQRLDAGTFMIYAPFGTLPIDMATRSIELFAAEVLPKLKERHVSDRRAAEAVIS